MPAITPCINACILDPATGLCRGCGRSADEIAAWSTMNDTDRMRVMSELPQRMANSPAPVDSAE